MREERKEKIKRLKEELVKRESAHWAELNRKPGFFEGWYTSASRWSESQNISVMRDMITMLECPPCPKTLSKKHYWKKKKSYKECKFCGFIDDELQKGV